MLELRGKNQRCTAYGEGYKSQFLFKEWEKRVKEINFCTRHGREGRDCKVVGGECHSAPVCVTL